MFVSYVFFFKQKTAYEMRISDWSSDVCSSDLIPEEIERGKGREDRHSGEVEMLWLSGDQAPGIDDQPHRGDGGRSVHEQSDPVAPAAKRADDDCQRSEERRVGKAGGSQCRSRWSPAH